MANKTTPIDQISTFFEYVPLRFARFSKISGATYSGVPQIVFSADVSFRIALLKPKSEIFSKVSSSLLNSRMLSGFRSLEWEKLKYKWAENSKNGKF